MNIMQQRLTLFILGLLTILLNNCGQSPSQVGNSPVSISGVKPSISPRPFFNPLEKKTETIILYYPDHQCQTLTPKRVDVPIKNSLDQAIKLSLSQEHSRYFPLAYRVFINHQKALATIDFRIPVNSKRPMTSLSTCEQLAIFGSLRSTLIFNRFWNIKKVKFTQKGEEIWL